MGVRFVSLCVLAGTGACVDAFSGSNVQINFTDATQTAARVGVTPAANQPPANTYFSLYGAQQRKDATGKIVENYLFEVERFEIVPLIDRQSPCFIDLENARFPGLHVTEFANKVEEQTGIKDPLNPPSGAKATDITDVLDAQARMTHLAPLESTVKAVVSASTAQYSTVGIETTCIDDNASADQTKFPPINCTGEKANALRLQLCHAFWNKHPDFYEGSDKVFTLPLSGQFYGPVHGTNPINGGFLGGTQFFVDYVLDNFDGYLINWQYKDLNGDGKPDVPTGATDEGPTGHVYMSGAPLHQARGVINVPMVNANDPGLNANMAIFADVSNDGTHF